MRTLRMCHEMTMIDIRLATADDILALHDFYAGIGRREDGYFERCFVEQEKRGRKIYLALLSPHLSPPPLEGARKPEYNEGRRGDDSFVVGYVMLNFVPRYNLYKKLGIPEIQDLNVAPEFRRQGIGRALVEHCEKECGAAAIGISVGLTKEYGAAQRLYVKMGYIPDGFGVTYDREGVAHGQRVAIDDDLCLMMVKELV